MYDPNKRSRMRALGTLNVVYNWYSSAVLIEIFSEKMYFWIKVIYIFQKIHNRYEKKTNLQKDKFGQKDDNLIKKKSWNPVRFL